MLQNKGNKGRTWKIDKTRALESFYSNAGGIGKVAVGLYDKGSNYKKIAAVIEQETGIKISHATVSRYAAIYRAKQAQEGKGSHEGAIGNV